MSGPKVYLVGAGIGCADLITLRGLDCIRQAGCIIYDNLIDKRLLEFAPPDCEMLFVGKSAGRHYMKQEEINSLLLEKARTKERVVRLKGGDPYIFGRGAEEALCLKNAGISFEVVPGVSSATAGPCFAGIPVTHREMARSLHIVTAHTSAGGLSQEDLRRYAQCKGTLVFLMGLSQVEKIAGGLIEGGMAPDMPAAVISQAGTPAQRTVSGALRDLARAAALAELTPPAIIVVGETVSLRNALCGGQARALEGVRLLITRPEKPDGALFSALVRAGASVDVSPMIKIQPLSSAANKIWHMLPAYTHLVFTSGTGVRLFFSELYGSGKDVRALHGMEVCAIGSSTARLLLDYGIRADIIPPEFNAQSLLETLQNRLTAGCRVLLPAGLKRSPLLERSLDRTCAVDVLPLYDTVLPREHLSAEQFDAGGYDGVIFSSGSAVRNFDSCIGISRLRLGGADAFSIGPSTSAALRSLGISPKESACAGLPALAQFIINHYKENKKC